MLSNRWSSVAMKAKKKEKDEMEDTLSNLENAEPELCIKLLLFPSVKNFSGLKKKIAQCTEEWMLVSCFSKTVLNLSFDKFFNINMTFAKKRC